MFEGMGLIDALQELNPEQIKQVACLVSFFEARDQLVNSLTRFNGKAFDALRENSRLDIHAGFFREDHCDE